MAGKPDLLARGKSKASVEVTKKADKGMREVVVPEAMRPKFIEFCELGYVGKSLEDTQKSHRSEVLAELLRIFVHEMWEGRKKPDNFRAVVPRITTTTDCSCNFVVSFRKDSLKDQVPKKEAIPKGKTFEEMAIANLEVIGLGRANAKRFVQEEIVVEEVMDLVNSFDYLYSCDEGTPQHTGAKKLLELTQCRTLAARNKIPLFTDEEESACFVVKQTLSWKEGMAERLFTYCDNEDQLMALIQWIKPTFTLSMFTVGEGDEKRILEERLSKTVVRFLFVA